DAIPPAWLHYKPCCIEKTVRASRRADLVIANHALVLTQAALDGARAARGQTPDVETSHLKRLVFDEGHHLFEAAPGAARAARGQRPAGETSHLKRLVFDEGHRLFEAADSAFAAVLS